MAIIDTLPGVHIFVVTNKGTKREYHDIAEDECDPDRPTLICYVEAVSKQKFRLQITFDRSFCYWGVPILVRTHIDGVQVNQRNFFMPHHKLGGPEHGGTIDGTYSTTVDGTAVSKFLFDNLIIGLLFEISSTLFRRLHYR